MSYYKFNQDVYVVKGAVTHCIYDLFHGFLYSINQETYDLIYSLINEEDFYRSLDEERLALVNYLTEMKILVESVIKTEMVDILSLRQKPSLQFSWIEVTRKCNLACTFCYEESSPYCTERMSLNDFYSVCEQLKEVGIKRIQFIGGEPMVIKDDLKKMILHCRDDFEFIEVYSNGILINDEWAKFFKTYNIAVALSIHSYIPEEHDCLTTVKGSHKRVLRGLNFLKKHQVQYRIGTVRNTACNIGVKSKNDDYELHPVEPKVVGRADLSQYNLEMFKRKAITKQSKSYPINKSRVITALSGHQCFIKDIYISSNLEVFPCVMERRLSHGNIKKNRLKDILNEKIRFLSKDHIEGCQNCEFRYGCFDCRPDSNGRGTYQKPWHCTYNPLEGKWYEVEEVFDRLKTESKSMISSIPVVIE
ncbi:MAG: radical SAM protein [Proteobacteria bacterium]|nr:radical SAM protein [Pseudomonadota bacterium]